MNSYYNINGKQMSEEEFNHWQKENGFDFGFKKRNKNYNKVHIYQCYKDTPPNRWNEITKEELKKDINNEPKFKKKLYYVQKNGRDYIIRESPVVVIFYNHIENTFLYMKEGGLIKEKNCFSSFEEAENAIKEMEKNKIGLHTLYDINGNILSSYFPSEKQKDDN